MPASVLIQRLNMLAKSDNEEIAMQALNRLADLEIQSDKSESKAGALKDEIRSLKKELVTARESLIAVTTERETLQARVSELEPLRSKADELNTLKYEQETWRTEQVACLTAESARQLRDAESARQKAEFALASADAKYAQDRLSHTMGAFQQIASRTQMPDFWAPEARKHSSLFWQSWFTSERAALWTALENSFADSPANFKLWAVRILHARLCGYCEKEPISQLDEKHEYSLAKAESLGNGVLESIQAEAEQQRDAHMAWHKEQQHAAAATYERQIALSGVGRTPIGNPEQEAGSGISLELHAPGCCCPAHGGIPSHLRTGEVVENF